MCPAKVDFRSRVHQNATSASDHRHHHHHHHRRTSPVEVPVPEPLTSQVASLIEIKLATSTETLRLRRLRAQTWASDRPPPPPPPPAAAKECQRNGQSTIVCMRRLFALSNSTSGISFASSIKLAACLLVILATDLAVGEPLAGATKSAPRMAPPRRLQAEANQMSAQLLSNAESFESLRRPTTKPQHQQQQQLSFRQASGSSSERFNGNNNETQWIPIRESADLAPRRQRQRPQPVDSRQLKPKPKLQPRPPVSHSSSNNNNNININVNNNLSRQQLNRPNRQTPNRSRQMQMQVEASRNSHFYRPPMGHYGTGGPSNWRRPRLNDEPFEVKTHRYYKKVLLCDKTLVSLDYVRNSLELEPRPLPYGSHYYDTSNSVLYDGVANEHNGNHIDNDSDNFVDNFIDLDSNLVEFASVMSTSAPQNIARSSQVANATTTTTTTSGEESLEASASVLADPRRSYLTDEDPLVKCDMWDLEKGLKKRKPPEHILRMAVKADFDTVRDAINRCGQLTERTLPAEDEYRDHGIDFMSTEDLVSLFSMKRGLLPGTKWCGLGDQASSYNDLGPKHRVDICCRAHDHCPIRLKPFRNDYGVRNIALYTKSHCDCDADFYRCLREVRSRTADLLGNLYFNVMKLQCMREERMKICREMKPLALGFEMCVRYEDSPVKTVFKFTTPPVAY